MRVQSFRIRQCLDDIPDLIQTALVDYLHSESLAEMTDIQFWIDYCLFSVGRTWFVHHIRCPNPKSRLLRSING